LLDAPKRKQTTKMSSASTSPLTPGYPPTVPLGEVTTLCKSGATPGGGDEFRTMYVSVYTVSSRGEHWLSKVLERRVEGIGHILPPRLMVRGNGDRDAHIPAEVCSAYRALLTAHPFCYCVYRCDGAGVNRKTARCKMAGIHEVNGGHPKEVVVHYTQVVGYRLCYDLSLVREQTDLEDPVLREILADPTGTVGGMSTEQYQACGVANTSLISYKMHESGEYYEYVGSNDVWCCMQALPYFVSNTSRFDTAICAIQRRTVQKCMENAQVVLVRENDDGKPPMQRRRLMYANVPMKEKGVFSLPSPSVSDGPVKALNCALMCKDPERLYPVCRVKILGKRWGFLKRVRACKGNKCNLGECWERKRRRVVGGDDLSSKRVAVSTLRFPMSSIGDENKENQRSGTTDKNDDADPKEVVHIVWDGDDVLPTGSEAEGLIKFRAPKWRVPCTNSQFEAMRCEDTALHFLVNPTTVEAPVRDR